MTDAAVQKAAVAAVKAAEKKYAAADKKSSAMREKYLGLQAETNRAARELAHARTNPDLYDDDPTQVVSPDQNSTSTTDSASVLVTTGDSPTVVAEKAADYIERSVKPKPTPEPESEPESDDDDDDYAPEPDPWDAEAVQAAKPEVAPEKPKRRRSSAKSAAAKKVVEEDDDSAAVDGDALGADKGYDSPVSVAAPF